MIFGGWGCSIFKKLHARSQDFSCMDGWGEGQGGRGGVRIGNETSRGSGAKFKKT